MKKSITRLLSSLLAINVNWCTFPNPICNWQHLFSLIFPCVLFLYSFFLCWFSATQSVTRKFRCAHGIGWTKSTGIRLWKWAWWGWWTLQRSHSTSTKTSRHHSTFRFECYTNHFDEKQSHAHQPIGLRSKWKIFFRRFVLVLIYFLCSTSFAFQPDVKNRFWKLFFFCKS